MTVWPVIRTENIRTADAEPVDSPLEGASRGTAPAVRSPAGNSTKRPADQDTAPAITIPVKTPSSKKSWRIRGALLALTTSAVAHAALVAFFAERTPREGMEAASDALSVEIILEAPPEKPAEPVVADEAASNAPADRQVAQIPEPEPEPAVSANTVESTPEEAESKSEDSAPSDSSQTVLAAPPAPTHPVEAIPLPTPRPTPPKAAAPKQVKASPAPATPVKKAKPSREKTQKKAPSQTNKKPAARPAKIATASRQGGATKGQQAAYARRLLNHVQRSKRYPREAQRQRITGSAGLTITINRAGRLVGARLRKSSGHAILDKEALAVARRAAPYPKPPQGVGDNQISFSVTLRFSR